MSSKKDAMADSHDATRPRASNAHDPATTDDRDDSQETALETSFGASGSPHGAEATGMEDEADRKVEPATLSPSGHPASAAHAPAVSSSSPTSSPAIGPSGGASARPVGSKTLFGLGDGGLPFPGLAKSLADLRAGYAESLARGEGAARAEGTPTAQFPAVAAPAAPDFLNEVTDALNAQARLARARALGGQTDGPAADAISGPGHRNIREATGESTGNWSVGTAARVSSWVEAEFEDPDDGPTLLTPGIISITEDAFEAPVLEPAPGVDTLGDTDAGQYLGNNLGSRAHLDATARAAEESVVIGMPTDEDSVTVVPMASAEMWAGAEPGTDTSQDAPPEGAKEALAAESAQTGEAPAPGLTSGDDVRTAAGEDVPPDGFAAAETVAEAAESATGAEIATAAEATAGAAAFAAAAEGVTSFARGAAEVGAEPSDEPPSDTQIDARLGRFGGIEGPTPIPEGPALSPDSNTATATAEPGWFAPRSTPVSPVAGAPAAAAAGTSTAPASSALASPVRTAARGTPTEGRPSGPAFATASGAAAGTRTSTPLSSLASVASLPAPPLVSADGKRLTLPPGTPAMGVPDRAQGGGKVNLRRASLAAMVGGAFAGGVLIGVLVGRGGGASARGTAGVALVSAPASSNPNPTLATAPASGAAASTATVTPIPAPPAPVPPGSSAPAATAAAPGPAAAAAAAPGSPPASPVAAIVVPALPAVPARAPASGSEPGRTGSSSNTPAGVQATAVEHVAKSTTGGGTRSQTPRPGAHARRPAAGGETAAAAPRTAPPPLVAQAPAATSPSSASKPAVAGRPQAIAPPKSTPASKPTGAVAKASVAKSAPPKGPWHDPFAD